MNIIVTLRSSDTPGIGACQPSQWTSQFMQPSGWLGRAVGHLMALKNATMNRLAVELLDVQPEDLILEIGFGPGTAIEMLAERATNGFVAGVDHSNVMVRQAAERNRRSIETGCVELRQGTVSSLPYEDDRFTKVCVVNSFHIWPDQELALREIWRVLKEGGLLVLCLRMKHPTRTVLVSPGFTEQEIEEVQRLLARVGFRNIRAKRHNIGQGITCVLANR